MALNKQVTSIARVKIGQYLFDIRKDKGYSRNEMVRLTGLTYQQIQAIETGSANYSIDAFLTYITALDCYFYLANKDGKENDLKHLVDKANDPA